MYAPRQRKRSRICYGEGARGAGWLFMWISGNHNEFNEHVMVALLVAFNISYSPKMLRPSYDQRYWFNISRGWLFLVGGSKTSLKIMANSKTHQKPIPTTRCPRSPFMTAYKKCTLLTHTVPGRGFKPPNYAPAPSDFSRAPLYTRVLLLTS